MARGSEDPFALFDGAQRYRSYHENAGEPNSPSAGLPAPGHRPVEDTTDGAPASVRPLRLASPPVEPSLPEVAALPIAATGVPAAPRRPSMFRRRRFPTADDRAALAAHEMRVRQWTSARSRNVLIANTKSSGKTITCLVLGGVLASIRGGSVAVTEATPMAGDLAARAEGCPDLGLGELVRVIHDVRSIGELSAFTAPQSSHATVIGSPSVRGPLRAGDIVAVRRLLDTYYALTVTDTANSTSENAFGAALSSTDAVVIPVTCSLASIRGAYNTLQAIYERRSQSSLEQRVVIVATRDGGPEDPALRAEFLPRLQQLGHPVIEVPFDPALRDDSRELSLSDLSERSRYAWTAVAAAVVDALSTAPGDPLIINPSSSENGETTNRTTHLGG
ncbi:hypothetical protein [Nocardioides sp. ChNu-99]|uniref:MinD/ParA family ATP-binding protein n=1 Tax=Nocardioides sp. ChNu-99 TaxID=2839897 RepID=UPI002406AD54|nr:hypothetical protein [Nocardioides sp. ChNu-99]MDF9716462.1 hypothetical protein [Nocardioides sp. ChNu-99]